MFSASAVPPQQCMSRSAIGSTSTHGCSCDLDRLPSGNTVPTSLPDNDKAVKPHECWLTLVPLSVAKATFLLSVMRPTLVLRPVAEGGEWLNLRRERHVSMRLLAQKESPARAASKPGVWRRRLRRQFGKLSLAGSRCFDRRLDVVGYEILFRGRPSSQSRSVITMRTKRRRT